MLVCDATRAAYVRVLAPVPGWPFGGGGEPGSEAGRVTRNLLGDRSVLVGAGVEWDSPGGKDRFALARAPVDDVRTPERTNEWALSPLGVWGLDRVRLPADLTILAKLACALSRARAVPVAA